MREGCFFFRLITANKIVVPARLAPLVLHPWQEADKIKTYTASLNSYKNIGNHTIFVFPVTISVAPDQSEQWEPLASQK